MNRTNNFIVNQVERTYKLDSLIKKLINDNNTQIHSDLKQYIFEVLLKMDNYKLNELYYKNELRKFIAQIIKNQRNSGRYYNSLTLNSNIHIDIDSLFNFDVEDGVEHDYRFDFVMDKIEHYNNVLMFYTGLTQVELRDIMCLSVVELYYVKRIEKFKICTMINSGMSTVNLLLKDGRKFLKNCWEEEGGEWLEKNNIVL